MVLSIQSATYGDHFSNQTIDVADKLKGWIQKEEGGGKLSVDVSGKTMGKDPAPGVKKTLKIVYTTGEGQKPQEIFTEEGDGLDLQGDPPKPSEAPPAETAAPPATEKPPAGEPTPTPTQATEGPAGEPGPESQQAAPEKVAEPEKAETDKAAATQVAPVSGSPITWKSADGQLTANGKKFDFRGVNWGGMETSNRMFNGLDKTTAREYLDLLASKGINALRVPISTSMALDLDSSPRVSVEDPDLKGLTTGQVLDKVVDLAAERGMQVMVDMHRLDEDQAAPDLWWSDKLSTEQLMQGWDNVICRLKTRSNFMGIDLKNEPHGQASWGSSNPTYDWNKAAEQIANHIVDSNSDWKGLFFIQGVSEANNVDADCKSGQPSWYGGNLQGAAKHPINLKDGASDRVVYAPHVFGPSTYNHGYFQGGDFPGNMWPIWQEHFGGIKDATGRAVVIGEFGGDLSTHEDRVWHQCIVDYMTQNGLSGFYQGSVAGEDYKSPIDDKFALLARMTPEPTRV